MERSEMFISEMVNLMFKIVSDTLDCECMALRLIDRNGDYPFFKYKGYSEEFINKENSLLDDDKNEIIDCLCAQVIKGTDGEIKQYFTEYGSVYLNMKEEKKIEQFKKTCDNFRGECLAQGFSSCALVPLKDKGECSGIFHLSDYNKNIFNEENISKFEKIAKYFAQIMLKIETADFSQQKLKILIADDEIQIALVLKKLFERCGNDCLSVSDGEEAFDYIVNNKIDLLITDINISKLNGLQLIRKVRRKYEIYGPKVIIITGSLHSISKNFILKNNISHIITKPFENIMEIPQIIEKVFK